MFPLESVQSCRSLPHVMGSPHLGVLSASPTPDDLCLIALLLLLVDGIDTVSRSSGLPRSSEIACQRAVATHPEDASD